MAISSQLTGCASFDGGKIEAGRVQSFNSSASFDNPRVQKAAEYVKSRDVSKMADGKYKIDDDISLSLSTVELRPVEAASLEAHKKFIDLQFPIDGNETMGVKKSAECKTIKTPYNEERDIMFFSDPSSEFVELKPGEFIIFTPEVAHAPCLGKGKVRKGVFKIKVD